MSSKSRGEPDGVTLCVPTDGRVIISEGVLVLPSLPVEELTREAQVVGYLRFLISVWSPPRLEILQSCPPTTGARVSRGGSLGSARNTETFLPR